MRSPDSSGWQRQAQLGDGGLAVRKTIAKAIGLHATNNVTKHPAVLEVVIARAQLQTPQGGGGSERE
jgi:hypothetical protein